MRIFLQISHLCPLSTLPEYDADVRVALLRISCLQLKVAIEALQEDKGAVRVALGSFGERRGNIWGTFRSHGVHSLPPIELVPRGRWRPKRYKDGP